MSQNCTYLTVETHEVPRLATQRQQDPDCGRPILQLVQILQREKETKLVTKVFSHGSRSTTLIKSRSFPPRHVVKRGDGRGEMVEGSWKRRVGKRETGFAGSTRGGDHPPTKCRIVDTFLPHHRTTNHCGFLTPSNT